MNNVNLSGGITSPSSSTARRDLSSSTCPSLFPSPPPRFHRFDDEPVRRVRCSLRGHDEDDEDEDDDVDVDVDVESEGRSRLSCPKIIASLVIYSVCASLPSRTFLLVSDGKKHRAE